MSLHKEHVRSGEAKLDADFGLGAQIPPQSSPAHIFHPLYTTFAVSHRQSSRKSTFLDQLLYRFPVKMYERILACCCGIGSAAQNADSRCIDLSV